METNVGMTAIAVGIMLGLAAVGAAIGIGLMVVVFLKVLLVNQKWQIHCKLKCSC